MATDLVLYLFEEGTTFDNCVSSSESFQDATQLSISDDLPYEHQAWVVAKTSDEPPSWASDFLTYFPDFEPVRKANNKLFMAFKAEGRLWGVTFGGGRFLINKNRIEPRFGLLVTANSSTRRNVVGAESQTGDMRSRQMKSSMPISRRSRLEELGISFDDELMKSLTASPDGDQLFNKLHGADSLKLSCNADLTELEKVAKHALQRRRSKEYLTEFDFLDNFIPLGGSDSRVEQLNQLLHSAILNGSSADLSMSLPRLFDDEDIGRIEVTRGKKVTIDLTIPQFLEALKELGVSSTADLAKTNITVQRWDDSGPLINKKPAASFINFETAYQGSTYLHCIGKWYEISESYAAKVNKKIKSLDTGATDLPDLCHVESIDGRKQLQMCEGCYNTNAALSQGLLNMDKSTIPHGGKSQQIEFADLWDSHTKKLIHVKKRTSSAALNHLWSQGEVAVDLYDSDSLFHQKVNEKFTGVGLPEKAQDINLVYAVACDTGKPISDSLFFMAKVALVNRVKMLQRVVRTVELAAIRITSQLEKTYEKCPSCTTKEKKYRAKQAKAQKDHR